MSISQPNDYTQKDAPLVQATAVETTAVNSKPKLLDTFKDTIGNATNKTLGIVDNTFNILKSVANSGEKTLDELGNTAVDTVKLANKTIDTATKTFEILDAGIKQTADITNATGQLITTAEKGLADNLEATFKVSKEFIDTGKDVAKFAKDSITNLNELQNTISSGVKTNFNNGIEIITGITDILKFPINLVQTKIEKYKNVNNKTEQREIINTIIKDLKTKYNKSSKEFIERCNKILNIKMNQYYQYIRLVQELGGCYILGHIPVKTCKKIDYNDTINIFKANLKEIRIEKTTFLRENQNKMENNMQFKIDYDKENIIKDILIQYETINNESLNLVLLDFNTLLQNIQKYTNKIKDTIDTLKNKQVYVPVPVQDANPIKDSVVDITSNGGKRTRKYKKKSTRKHKKRYTKRRTNYNLK